MAPCERLYYRHKTVHALRLVQGRALAEGNYPGQDVRAEE